MKKTALYLFLFTYSMVMLKPVMPFVTDAVAHLLFYKDHMMTVHAHNGKFHVHAAITEGAKNDQSEKSTNNFKKDNQVNDHIFYDTYQMHTLTALPSYNNCLPVVLTNTSIDYDYPPPRACSL